MTEGADAARARVENVARDLLPGEPDLVLVWAPTDNGGSSSTKGGHPVITMSVPLLTHVEVALFVAAHEAGHIGLGHVAGRARTVGIYLGSFVVCLIIGCAIAVALLGWSRGLNLAPLAMLVWIVAQRPLLARLKQPQELAADQFAARHGYRLTAGIRSVLDEPLSRADTWVRWLFPTHPAWATRLAVSTSMTTAIRGDRGGYQRHS